jgi:hypothetical protein
LKKWDKDLFRECIRKPFSEDSDWPQNNTMWRLSSDLHYCDFINSNVEGDSAEVWVCPAFEVGPGGRRVKRSDKFKFDLVKEAEDWKIKEFGFYEGIDNCFQRWSPEMQLEEISLDWRHLGKIKKYGHPFLVLGDWSIHGYSDLFEKSSP